MRQLIDDIIDWLARVFGKKERPYETTILRDIEKIGDLLAPEFPYDRVAGVRKYRILRVMILRAERKVAEKLPLRTLEKKLGDVWEVCLDEYESAFETNSHKYKKVILNDICDIVEKNFNDIRYQHIFIKYEDSIHTTYNALKEYLHLNKSIELDSEIMKKAHTIFNSLKSALEKRGEEIANLEKKKDKASNESYLERLDNEIEYIKKYVE